VFGSFPELLALLWVRVSIDFHAFERESLTSIFLPIGNAGQRMGRELNFNRITYSGVGVKISKGCLLRYFVKALDMMCVIAVDLMIEHVIVFLNWTTACPQLIDRTAKVTLETTLFMAESDSSGTI